VATILVVDDEEVVRCVVRDMLEPEGHTVIDTEDPLDALRLAREQPIHLLLTDVVMPQMRGTELASRVSGESPSTRILLMSAYAMSEMVATGRAFIDKPFTIRSLTDKVRQLLDQPSTLTAGA
jgi:two-component system cell cycle sensor histidine kinase/response regulator CckA